MTPTFASASGGCHRCDGTDVAILQHDSTEQRQRWRKRGGEASMQWGTRVANGEMAVGGVISAIQHTVGNYRGSEVMADYSQSPSRYYEALVSGISGTFPFRFRKMHNLQASRKGEPYTYLFRLPAHQKKASTFVLIKFQCFAVWLGLCVPYQKVSGSSPMSLFGPFTLIGPGVWGSSCICSLAFQLNKPSILSVYINHWSH